MRSRSLGPSALLPATAVAIVSLFTIEQLRLFVSGLTFGLGEARELPVWVVGVVGLAVVSLSLLSVTVVSDASRRLAVQLTAVLVLVRVFSQAVDDPLALLAVSAVGVVLAGLAFPILAIVYRGQIVGVGLVLGGVIDIAVMAARHTLGLTSSSSAAAMGFVVVLGALAVVALAIEGRASSFVTYGPAPPAAAAFMAGPWLALHLTISGNLGFVGARTGMGLVSAAAVCAVGAAIAVGWSAPARSSPQPAVSGAVLVGALFILGSAEGIAAAFVVVVVAVAGGSALTGAFDRETTAPPDRVAWAGGVGMMVGFGALMVVYLPFAGYEALSFPVLLSIIGLPALGAGLACLPHRGGSAGRWLTPAIFAGALLAVPLVVGTTAPEGSDVTFFGDPLVLTYNLNHGFGADGRFSLEAMAQVIESADPDIVVLQEVSRGWVATGGVDMVAWLGHRLGMPMVFAGTADPQWGVALGSTFEMSSPAVAPLGDQRVVPSRAALDVMLDVRNDLALRLIVVQLHQQSSEQDIRRAQVHDLLNVWGGSDLTIVVGDLGGAPSDPAMSELFAAGLRDSSRLVDGSTATVPAYEPVSQHDFILISDGLAVSAAGVIPDVASDHLGVLARIGLLADPPEDP